MCQGLVPYLEKDYTLLTPFGVKIPSYEAYKNIYQFEGGIYTYPKDIKLVTNNDSYYIASTTNKYYLRIRNNANCRYTNYYIICKLPLS